jgi:hypothetical protein
MWSCSHCSTLAEVETWIIFRMAPFFLNIPPHKRDFLHKPRWFIGSDNLVFRYLPVAIYLSLFPTMPRIIKARNHYSKNSVFVPHTSYSCPFAGL